MIVGNVDDREKYSMFFPKSRRKLIDDYPELGRIEAFTKLNRTEMLFVWYYACQASPYYDQDDFGRIIELCLRKSYGSKIRPEMKERFISGNFPEKISVAVDVMKRFEVGPRIRAKRMVEKILDNFEVIVNVDVNKDMQFYDNGVISPAKKKIYSETCTHISKQMTTLLAQIEEGYGVIKLDESGSEELGNSFIQDYHQRD